VKRPSFALFPSRLLFDFCHFPILPVVSITYLQGAHHLPVCISDSPFFLNLMDMHSENIVWRSLVVSTFNGRLSGISARCCSLRLLVSYVIGISFCSTLASSLMMHLIAVPFIHVHLLDGFIFILILLNFLGLSLITTVLFDLFPYLLLQLGTRFLAKPLALLP
jgi:hypothetical protein